MARIAGVNLPEKKRVEFALRYIYGIGPARSKAICAALKIPEEKRVYELSDDDVLQIREYIDKEYQVEGDLRRQVGLDIKRLIEIGCYRGLRHRKNLPVRGQRSKTNARTRKGPRKTMANKKK